MGWLLFPDFSLADGCGELGVISLHFVMLRL